MKGFVLKVAFLVLAGLPLYGSDNTIKFNDILDDKSNQDKIIDNYIKDIKRELSPNQQEKEIISDKILSGSNIEIKSIQVESLNIEDQDESNRIRNFNKIEPVDNEMVKFFVQYYTTAGREYLIRSLERMETYYPVVEKYLKKYGLPLEVSLLIIVESGYMPKALSTKGALGLWQLMPLTAKIYGLKINQYVDERMDVEKSSFAATRYIRDLIETFNGNWELVLASYNGGGGYINSQIRKQKENDFWKLCKASGFKSETLEYVPRFYALLNILKNPEKYDIKAPFLSSKTSFETIVNAKNLSFKSISEYTGVLENTLRELNPHFKEDIALKNCNLFVPSSMSNLVAGRLNRNVREERIAIRFAGQNDNEVTYSNKPKKKQTANVYKHIVQSKETLSQIAKRYHTTAYKIKKYNNVKKINKGMVLMIPVYQSSYSSQVKKNSAGLSVNTSNYNKSKVTVHKVKSGDTLMSIARKYNLNVQDIRQMNNIKGDVIKKGQMIQVRSAGGASSSGTKKSIVSYRVKKGDTLYSLSKRFNIEIARLVSYNKIGSNQLVTGKTILIPRKEG